jgi:predicted HTH domain antitoxin
MSGFDLILASCLVVGYFGMHRISEIYAYTVKMFSEDLEGRGIWMEFDKGTKTVASGVLVFP